MGGVQSIRYYAHWQLCRRNILDNQDVYLDPKDARAEQSATNHQWATRLSVRSAALWLRLFGQGQWIGSGNAIL